MKKTETLPLRTGNTFSGHLLDVLADAGVILRDPSASDALAELPYETELAAKQEAFVRLWKEERLPGKVPSVIPSVRPRRYRTTSKRHAFYARGRFHLEMGYGDGRGKGGGAALEAELHARLYRILLERLNALPFAECARSLNFCIIRGNYEEAALILNVFRANGPIVRKFRELCLELQEAEPGLKSAFLLVDESRSDYYLDTAARTGKNRMFKKFFGPGMLVQMLGGKKLFYPPEVFSQVNGSMCEAFADAALKLLDPPKTGRVFDLFCGYGLLSMKAADRVDHVFGMDWEGPAIRAAAANAEHLYPGKDIRFAACAVTGETLQTRLPVPRGKEYVILDPPRTGIRADIIETLAARAPERILHIFCGTDAIPGALKHWLANGRTAAGMKILDMFPGSMNLETMILLNRS